MASIDFSLMLAWIVISLAVMGFGLLRRSSLITGLGCLSMVVMVAGFDRVIVGHYTNSPTQTCVQSGSSTTCTPNATTQTDIPAYLPTAMRLFIGLSMAAFASVPFIRWGIS